MFMYASHIIPKYRYKLMVVPSYVTKKMMQTQVCKGSNHMFVIPQEKEKKMLHTCVHRLYPCINEVRSKLCMIHHVFMLQHMMAKNNVTCNLLSLSRAWRPGTKKYFLSQFNGRHIM